MSEELKPCKCGEDINRSFEIQLLWTGYSHTVGVAYCNRCKEVEPFKIQYPYRDKDITPAAIKAWNSRINEGGE